LVKGLVNYLKDTILSGSSEIMLWFTYIAFVTSVHGGFEPRGGSTTRLGDLEQETCILWIGKKLSLLVGVCS
jgi:hypothetical protein